MKLHVKHTTDYRYTEPLRYALQTLWLTPLTGPAQTVNFWSLGAPKELFAQHDAFGNSIHSYTFVGEAVRQRALEPGQCGRRRGNPGRRANSPTPLACRCRSFTCAPSSLAQPHPRLAEFGRRFITPQPGGKADLQEILALSAGVAGAVSYLKNSTNVTTTALQAFEAGAGVCQDQAHVMVAVCRSLGHSGALRQRVFLRRQRARPGQPRLGRCLPGHGRPALGQH